LDSDAHGYATDQSSHESEDQSLCRLLCH
jgi:hypothetical protein